MNSTKQFKDTIQSYLEDFAKKDPLFAATLKKENKNIDDCITYILNEVQKSGCNGFADDEIYNMAVHYYDEDKIKVGKPTSANIVVNKHIELSEEEIKEAKQKAINEVINKEKERLTAIAEKPNKKPEKAKENLITTAPSMFDL